MHDKIIYSENKAKKSCIILIYIIIIIVMISMKTALIFQEHKY